MTREKITGLYIPSIEDVYEKMKTDDPRKAAEIAFVIAMKAKADGDEEKAVRFAKESISFFDKLNAQTVEECAAYYTR